MFCYEQFRREAHLTLLFGGDRCQSAAEVVIFPIFDLCEIQDAVFYADDVNLAVPRPPIPRHDLMSVRRQPICRRLLARVANGAGSERYR